MKYCTNTECCLSVMGDLLSRGGYFKQEKFSTWKTENVSTCETCFSLNHKTEQVTFNFNYFHGSRKMCLQLLDFCIPV